MRRQMGACAAPIASSSAGLRFQVAIIEGCCIARSCRWNESSTLRSPRNDKQWSGDQAAEGDHADGDGDEHAGKAPAQDLDGIPAADRGDEEAGEAGDERRL